jgi:hypothetical protein
VVRLVRSTLSCEGVNDANDRPVDDALGDQDVGDGEDEFGGAGALVHPGGGLFDRLAGDSNFGLGLCLSGFGCYIMRHDSFSRI